MIKLDLTNLNKKIDFEKFQNKVSKIHEGIHKKTLAGNDFLGWLDYTKIYDEKILDSIQKTGNYIAKNYDVLVVCGIGGSYLGAKSVIDFLTAYKLPKIEVIFLGNTLSSDKICQTLEYLKNKKFAINVISKSGGTIETSISFRLLQQLLIKKVGIKESQKSIFVVTDKSEGTLKKVAEKNNYMTFELPRDIGGRYSVFSPVGLISIAACGYNLKEIFKGISSASKDLLNSDLRKNDAYKYAVSRFVEYSVNKCDSELFVTYNPYLLSFQEWIKQLHGESEGKDGKGLFPMSVLFTTDLHSLGQIIQDGYKHYFETIFHIENPCNDIKIPKLKDNTDNLNYLSDKTLSFINTKAYEATLKAHHEQAKLDCIVFKIDKISEFNVGYLYFFLMKACAMYCYLLNVNPFDQPGVQAYKDIMFRYLGKKK